MNITCGFKPKQFLLPDVSTLSREFSASELETMTRLNKMMRDMIEETSSEYNLKNRFIILYKMLFNICNNATYAEYLALNILS